MKKVLLLAITITVFLLIAMTGELMTKADDDYFEVAGMQYTKDEFKQIKKEYKRFKKEQKYRGDYNEDAFFEVDGKQYTKKDYKQIKKEYKRFKKEQEYREDDYDYDDDHDGYGTDADDRAQLIDNHTHDWRVWSKRLHKNKGDLPITESSKLTFIRDDQVREELDVIPYDGELFVQSAQFAPFLGAKVIFYQQSKIAVFEKDGTELITRAGTNVAYENKLKRPLPANALYYQGSLYVPISVVANTFHYDIDWNEQDAVIQLKLAY